MKLIVIIVFLFDQICKCWINKNLAVGESREILSNKLYITNAKNKGLAMGVFSENRPVVLSATVFALISSYRLWKHTKGPEKLGVAIMSGGGLSNAYDRFVKGEVTDYIYFKFQKKTPVFNFADVFALIGFFVALAGRFLVCVNKPKFDASNNRLG